MTSDSNNTNADEAPEQRSLLSFFDDGVIEDVKRAIEEQELREGLKLAEKKKNRLLGPDLRDHPVTLRAPGGALRADRVSRGDRIDIRV